jgi:hypothetical protein
MASRDISLNIVADIERYQRELAKLPGATDKRAFAAAVAMEKRLATAQANAAKQAKKAAEDSAAAWSQFGSVLAANLSADAVKAAARAVVDYADSIAASVDEVNTLAVQSGLANETIAGLRFAAEATGKQLSELVPPDLAKRILETSQETGEAKRGFDALKVSVTDSEGRLKSADAVLRETIDALQAVEDPTQRAALATQALGEKGALMLSTLSSSDSLEAFVEQAERFGVDVGPAAVAATGDWQQAQAELGLALDAAARGVFELGGGLEGATGFLKNFTLGLVAASEFARSFAESGLESMREQGEALSKLLSGDLKGALDTYRDATGFDVLGEAFQKAKSDSLEVAEAFFRQSQATEQAREQAAELEKEVGGLADVQTRAAKGAKTHADELERLNAEGFKATATLAEISSKATADLLDDEGRILQARDEQLDKIAELKNELADLAEQGVDTSRQRVAAEVAALDVYARANRDLEAVREKAHAAELERMAEFEASSDELLQSIDELGIQIRERQLETFLQSLSVVESFAATAFSVLTELSRRAQQEAADALEAARENVQTLRDERAALREQLVEEENEIERARIEARLNELDAELGAAKQSRKRRLKDARDAWKASKQLALSEVVFNTAAAVLQAYAMFGPPPSPIGIAASAAAGTAGAAQAALIATEKPPQFHTGIDDLLGPRPSFTRGPDERIAALTTGEAVLNARAADSLGRETVAELNRTGGGGGGSVFELSFEGRQIDTLVTRTLARGGRARRAISNLSRTRPVGQVPVYGGR